MEAVFFIRNLVIALLLSGLVFYMGKVFFTAWMENRREKAALEKRKQVIHRAIQALDKDGTQEKLVNWLLEVGVLSHDRLSINFKEWKAEGEAPFTLTLTPLLKDPERHAVATQDIAIVLASLIHGNVATLGNIADQVVKYFPRVQEREVLYLCMERTRHTATAKSLEWEVAQLLTRQAERHVEQADADAVMESKRLLSPENCGTGAEF